MEYKKMIEEAKRNGVATNEKMWDSIAAVEMLLEEIEDEDIKWRFLRKQHELMYGHHYDKEFADVDMGDLSYTDRNGKQHIGPHWTCQDVESAMSSFSFPNGVTKWDKAVAANAMYADLNKWFSDEEVLRAAHAFYFEDEDWPHPACKVWQYMSAKQWYDSKK